MANWRATYKTVILNSTTTIKPDGFSCITFQNKGDDNFTILNDIEINVGDSDFSLINLPNIEIGQEILIKFSGSGSSPVCKVIKTYYEKI